MTAEDFAGLWKTYKDELVESFAEIPGETLVGSLIDKMELTDPQKQQMREVLDVALTDCIYGLLLGLDGCANIGGKQLDYKLTDEDGDLIAGDCGALEAAAWEAFHGEG